VLQTLPACADMKKIAKQGCSACRRDRRFTEQAYFLFPAQQQNSTQFTDDGQDRVCKKRQAERIPEPESRRLFRFPNFIPSF